MAEKQENNLIGVDPLAWMDEDGGGQQQSTSLKNEQTVDDVAEKMEAVSEDSEHEKPQEGIAAQNAEEKAAPLMLKAVQNIQNVTELHQDLSTLFEKTDKIEIDASDVTSIDTATMQLLIVLKQSAIHEHKQVSFDFPSERFIEAADLLGLSAMLELESAGGAGFFR